MNNPTPEFNPRPIFPHPTRRVATGRRESRPLFFPLSFFLSDRVPHLPRPALHAWPTAAAVAAGAHRPPPFSFSSLPFFSFLLLYFFFSFSISFSHFSPFPFFFLFLPLSFLSPSPSSASLPHAAPPRSAAPRAPLRCAAAAPRPGRPCARARTHTSHRAALSHARPRLPAHRARANAPSRSAAPRRTPVTRAHAHDARRAEPLAHALHARTNARATRRAPSAVPLAACGLDAGYPDPPAHCSHVRSCAARRCCPVLAPLPLASHRLGPPSPAAPPRPDTGKR